jgi:hypothetical protein
VTARPTALVAQLAVQLLSTAALAASGEGSYLAGFCEDTTRAGEAQQADAVFTGTVAEVSIYRQRLARIAGRELEVPAGWPGWLPIPAEAPAEERTDVRFQAETLYKGILSRDVSVRWTGRRQQFRRGVRHTVFANIDGSHLFSTECAGNVAGPIEPDLYGLAPKAFNDRTEEAPLLRQALAVVTLLLLAVAAVIVVTALRRRRFGRELR